MPVPVDAPTLARALGAVVPAAQSAVVPAVGLARLSIVADQSGMVQAIGNEVTATARFNVASLPMETLEVFVPAKKVANMLGALGPVTVELDVQADVLHVRSPRSAMTARGLAPDGVPVTPPDVEPQKAPWWPSLVDLIYAASTDLTKPALQSVQLADGWAFCTDSYRIAARRTDYSGEPMLIPSELVREAATVCGEVEAVIESEGRLCAFGGSGWVRASLVQAQPLNWRQLAPLEQAKPRGSFSAAAMTEGLRVCRSALDDLSHGNARVRLVGHGDSIELSVGSTADSLTVVAAIDATDAELDSVTFNPLFLAGAIEQIAHSSAEVYYHQIERTSTWFGLFSPLPDPTAADQFAVVVPYHV